MSESLCMNLHYLLKNLDIFFLSLAQNLVTRNKRKYAGSLKTFRYSRNLWWSDRNLSYHPDSWMFQTRRGDSG